MKKSKMSKTECREHAKFIRKVDRLHRRIVSLLKWTGGGSELENKRMIVYLHDENCDRLEEIADEMIHSGNLLRESLDLQDSIRIPADKDLGSVGTNQVACRHFTAETIKKNPIIGKTGTLTYMDDPVDALLSDSIPAPAVPATENHQNRSQSPAKPAPKMTVHEDPYVPEGRPNFRDE